jgi:hypothetical protein
MSSVKCLPTLSPQAIEEFRTNALRIRAPVSAERLWSRYLTLQDRQRLGGDIQKAYKKFSTAGMWMKIRGVSFPRAIAEVAMKLGFLRQDDYEWLLREAGEIVEGEEALDVAIASGAFVLVQHPREAYWKRERINIDWHRQNVLWDFLWELGCAGKAGQPIDGFTFGENSNPEIVTKRKHRLSKLEEFPIDLIFAIESVARGTQQLKLPQAQIRVFQWDGADGLREWHP